MLSNTFVKTLFTKRWMLITWSLGLLLLTIFTMLFFPTFKEVGQSFQDVPESLKGFLGDSSTYKSVAGYADLQIVSQYVFMTLILGIVLLTGLLAGDEANGTLQTLLVQPIGRARIYLEKLAAGLVILAISSLAIALGILIGALIIGESVSIVRLLQAVLGIWLITVVFSVLGYALGAITGKRGLAGGIAGVLAFVSLLVNSLAESVKSLKQVDKLLPFHYFNKPGILQHGIRWQDMLILAIVSLAILTIGYIIFLKRDIYQR